MAATGSKGVRPIVHCKSARSSCRRSQSEDMSKGRGSLHTIASQIHYKLMFLLCVCALLMNFAKTEAMCMDHHYQNGSHQPQYYDAITQFGFSHLGVLCSRYI